MISSSMSTVFSSIDQVRSRGIAAQSVPSDLSAVCPVDGQERPVFHRFNGKDITKVNKKQLMKLREEKQIIFQDPFSSLNPRMTVSETVTEPPLLSKLFSKKEAEERADEIMNTVGLSARLWNFYPMSWMEEDSSESVSPVPLY